MNYRNIYIHIIKQAISQNRNKKDAYYEMHHILPKSLFPNWKSKKSNKVLLTAREHYFCHQLLTKIYPHENLLYALWRLANDRQNKQCSSKEYERLKIIISQKMKNNNPCFSEKGQERLKMFERVREEKKRIKELKKQEELENKKVICLNTLEVFNNTNEAGKWCGISFSRIYNCCIKRPSWITAGNHPETNERLQWQFYKDYLNGEKPLKNIKKRKVICIETDEIFKTITEAAKVKNIKSIGSLCLCLQGKRNMCGGYHWRYA